MRILLETTLLADAAAGAPHRGLTVNSQQIVDEANFVRSANAAFYARENRSVRLQFGVEWQLGSIRDAEAFVLLHEASVPREGLLTCSCGQPGAEQLVYLRDCVVESVQLSYVGVSVHAQYSLVGAKFEGDVPPAIIPGDPEPAEENPVKRRGKQAIAAGAASVAVAFSAPLSGVPTLAFAVSRPTGGQRIDAVLCEETVTINGFTVELSAPTPDASYVLHYVAYE